MVLFSCCKVVCICATKVYGGWGGGITPCIINFGTISRWVVSYMPQLHCLEISPDRHWVGHHVDPRARLDILCKNICCLYWEAKHSSSIVQHVSYILSWLLLHAMYFLLFSYSSCITGYICMSHNPVSVFIYCLHLLWTATLCLRSQMLLCRVLHCMMGTHAKKLYYWHFSEFLMLCGKRICCGWHTWVMQNFVEQTYAASVPSIVLAYKLRLSRIVMCTVVCIISTTFWPHSTSRT